MLINTNIASTKLIKRIKDADEVKDKAYIKKIV
jgi:hypothetical protein